MKRTKKLIEVALPLDAINEASAREKSLRHGHPSTLHQWWARRPLAAARAVIFAQLVDDPSEYVDVLLSDPKKKRAAKHDLRRRIAEHVARRGDANGDTTDLPEPTLADVLAEHERERLFEIIKAMVRWESTTKETVLQQVRNEILQSWRRTCANNADHPRAAELFNRNKLPSFHDPFAGGGALPLEALRLGIEASASDLNPVAVLINKAMIEIPPRFAGRPPVNEEYNLDQNKFEKLWQGTQGLVADMLYYGKWMRDQAETRIGHLYPKIEITGEMAEARPDLEPYVGRNLTIVAFLWARTVRSPNPAFSDIHVPLATSFILANKIGQEAYVEPVIGDRNFRFIVKIGKPTDLDSTSKGTKLSRGNFRCLMSNIPIPYAYINSEANAGRTSQRMMAVVAETDRRRVFLSPTDYLESIARSAQPKWMPDLPSRGTWGANRPGPQYGFKTFGDYFTPRQLSTLTTFADLIPEVYEKVRAAGCKFCSVDDAVSFRDGGEGPTAYAEAISVYLALSIGRLADRASTICTWNIGPGSIRSTFARQAIPMTWDYAEGNPLSTSSGSFAATLELMSKALLAFPTHLKGVATQEDAALRNSPPPPTIVSTDPPYYDNIGYADLSDFFYVWLRPTLRHIFPSLFSTVAVPKMEEIVAESYRHGSKKSAETFFLDRMTRALELLAERSHPALPLTIYYAFKQSETTDGNVVRTGWETFLDAIISAGFEIRGTWPVRTERGARSVAIGTNSLASSIVLVCCLRSVNAPTATLRAFISSLKNDIPNALKDMQHSGIAPVDLAQAAIGPGMAIFTRYSRILDASGKTLSVRDALALINQTLDEALTEYESDLDANSQWALAWFEQFGFDEADYGIAETLSTAKNASVIGLVDAGILRSRGGRVKLLKPEELSPSWDPELNARLTIWEVAHHLIRALQSEGEEAAGNVLRATGHRGETARELCYRLYALCERKNRLAEAIPYNMLVKSWPAITLRASAQKSQQDSLLSKEAQASGHHQQ